MTPETTLLAALLAGALIGLSLGALGGGGSILAVPVLVYLLGQSPAQATTGSLVVVATTSLAGAVAAARSGHVLLARGVAFGAVATGGAVLGAKASAHVDDDVLLAAFAALMLLVGALMAVRLVRRPGDGPSHAARPALDDPIFTFSPTFACACPRALKVLLTATLVGGLTGFLGVGGGFLVVPALLLALALPLPYAAGTSLVVITITSAAALATRAGVGPAPDWGLVLALTAASALTAVVGARLADCVDTRRLSAAFTALVLAVAAYTATQALPALL
ncbi:TSUP family transporter [Nocardioides kribbensis]|uniref:TSUP family transporter n=1 Tax=Nocardioides kribbensis TaxID=305517 RepID=UPI00187ABBA0|nr:sulfite exporter TauE/SafE family protein [Nocardioides kribbensis]